MDKVLKEKVTFFGITMEFVDVLFGLVLIMLGMVVRISIFNMASGDYTTAFADWMVEIRNAHAAGIPYIGIEPGGTDHLSTFDYNCLYQYLIVFLNLFNNGGANDIYLVKMASCAFDIVSAVTFFRIVYEMTHNVHKSMLSLGVALVIPTMLLNGAGWAQNDSIYTSFLLLSFLSLLKKRDARTWMYFAIAFCWKQQAIFFAPVLIIAWLKDHLKLRYVLFIPVMYIAVMIPAAIAGAMVPDQVTVLASSLTDTGNVDWATDVVTTNGTVILEPVGRTIGSLLGIYGDQVSMFTRLTLNYPNIYTIVQTGLTSDYRSMIITAGEVVTVMLMGILAYYLYQKKIRMNGLFLVTLTVFSAELIVYCLPCMHERYGFVAEVFAFIYGMFGWKRLCAAIGFQAVTLVTYTRYLWGASGSLTTENLVIFAFILMGLILFVGHDLYRQIQE